MQSSAPSSIPPSPTRLYAPTARSKSWCVISIVSHVSVAHWSQVQRYDCIYLHYTSAEDYRNEVDLLRCSPDFQANSDTWFDCVNINLDPAVLDFARILYLFCCRLPGPEKREEDVALVRLFKPARWKPKTFWENCRVLEDGRTMFMLPKYFIRGAHLINAFGAPREDTTFYLNDVVDSDWFIRAGN
ncbi:hypothetical protein GGX14DRAFT_345819 [Mycena pura]|uniref:Uncharacterized protein n=1 Tax=Mycena pura TaxID=153505 RepID=A0AAD7E5Y2_9AGAR|nr:hypothetical protein GGX14DRAFT_345819 [Mycena pura]